MARPRLTGPIDLWDVGKGMDFEIPSPLIRLFEDLALERTPASSPEAAMRPGLHAFARKVNGDRFCFYPPWRDGDRVPVIYCTHASADSELFARDFDEFLVRVIIEAHAAACEDSTVLAEAFLAHRATVRHSVREDLHPFLDRLGDGRTTDEVEAVAEALRATIPARRLATAMMPTTYDEATVAASERGRSAVVEAYETSERFYEELVEAEGRSAFQPALDEVRERLEELRGPGSHELRLMIDHVSLSVADVGRARTFYRAALRPLGLAIVGDYPAEVTQTVDAVGFGIGRKGSFWLAGGGQQTPATHLCFRAKSRAAVRAFYTAALAAGGLDNGPPGVRHQYHDAYYAAFVRDPEGHNIEAVCFEGEP